jgi:hypothetical protein
VNTHLIPATTARRWQQSLAVVALAASVSACSTVTHGAVVVGDRGPCTHVNAPMAEIPTRGGEPQMRIPEPLGWDRSTELADAAEGIRFALTGTDLDSTDRAPNVAAVIVEAVPGADADADAQTIFDEFEAGFVDRLAEEGLSLDLTTTKGTLCGLPSATLTHAASGMSLGAPANGQPLNSTTTLLVVAESGGDTYLIAVVQTNESDNPRYQRDADTIREGFEVVPTA